MLLLSVNKKWRDYVIPPTDQRTICAYSAIVIVVGPDGPERSRGSLRLAKVVETPTGHGTVDAHVTAMEIANAD